tara:strand:+ start:97 stop:1149 length:1053 start_codon:yes stop_codon:yes gene_type:complete
MIIEFKKLIKNKILCKQKLSIRDALKCLETNKLKIILVCADNNPKKIIGTLTDGDVRRAIINNNDLNSSINKFINKKFKSVNNLMTLKDKLSFLSYHSVSHLPILDNNNEIVELLVSDEISNNCIENPIVIMAGGLGKRLQPYTQEIPKPLVMLKNKPLIRHVIDNVKQSGFTNIIISLYHKSDLVINYLEKQNLPLNIEYVVEKKPLGTIGSLSLIKNKIKKDFILTNCDVVTNLDYSKLLNFHLSNENQFTIAIKKYSFTLDYGVVEIKKNKISKFIEKPQHQELVSTGVYAINHQLIKNLTKNKRLDANLFINNLKNQNINISPFLLYEEWNDVGRVEDLNRLININ